MKLKKLGAAFLALCMILTLLPATAFAADGTATDVSKLTMSVVCNSGDSIEIGTNVDLTITVTNPTAKDIDLGGCTLAITRLGCEWGAGPEVKPHVLEEGTILRKNGDKLNIATSLTEEFVPWLEYVSQDYEVSLSSASSRTAASFSISYSPDYSGHMDMNDAGYVSIVPASVSAGAGMRIPEKLYLQEENYQLLFSYRNILSVPIKLHFSWDFLYTPVTQDAAPEIPVTHVSSSGLTWDAEAQSYSGIIQPGETAECRASMNLKALKDNIAPGSLILFMPNASCTNYSGEDVSIAPFYGNYSRIETVDAAYGENSYKFVLRSSEYPYSQSPFPLPEEELLALALDDPQPQTFSLDVLEVRPDGTEAPISTDGLLVDVSGGSHIEWTCTERTDKTGYILKAKALTATSASAADTLSVRLMNTPDFGTVAPAAWNFHVLSKATNVNRLNLSIAQNTPGPVKAGETIPMTITLENPTTEDMDLTGCQLSCSDRSATMPFIADGTILRAGETMTFQIAPKSLRSPETCQDYVDWQGVRRGGQMRFEVHLSAPAGLDYPGVKSSTIIVDFLPDSQKPALEFSLAPTNKKPSTEYPAIPDTLYLGEGSYDFHLSLTNTYESQLYLDNDCQFTKTSGNNRIHVPLEPVSAKNAFWAPADRFGTYGAQYKLYDIMPGETVEFTARIQSSALRELFADGDSMDFVPSIRHILGPDEAINLFGMLGYEYQYSIAIAGDELNVGSLNTVPDALLETAPTVEALKEQLVAAIPSAKAEQSALYDVELMTSFADGTKAPIPADQFPAEGLEVTLPYPEKVDPATHDFKVSHMFDETVNGHKVGEIETPAVTEEKDGLHFTLSGTSPVLLSWTKKSDSGNGGNGGNGGGGGGIVIPPIGPVEPPVEPEKPELPETGAFPFTDVAEGSWYYDAVKQAYEKGIVSGVSETAFAPSTKVSRAMMAQLLYNLAGKPDFTASVRFDDVADGAWYADAVAWAAANKVVAGYGNGSFGPDDLVTREQMAVMLWNYSKQPAASAEVLTFTDTDEISAWAADAAAWAVENKVINGVGGNKMAPKATAIRAEVATMLMNFVSMQK